MASFNYNSNIFEESLRCANQANLAIENLSTLTGKVKGCNIPSDFSNNMEISDTISNILNVG